VQVRVRSTTSDEYAGTRGRARRFRRPAVRTVVAATVLTLALAGCTSEGGASRDATPSPTPVSESTTPPTTPLTFGVYGPRDEVAALQGVVENYNSISDNGDVEVRPWRDHDSLVADLESGEDLPDVFMASRDDLAWLQEQELIQPVDELLDERGVDFGDGYSRDALLAFSDDNRLQCMPYGVSPMVIYYNKELIDFAKMIRRGLDAPDLSEGDTRWSFDQFAAAAGFATRPRRQTRGVHVEPTLRSLAPFVYSGDGPLFDDDEQPTSLSLSDDDTRAALERTLELLRDPHLTLTDKQLARATPLQWFKRGRLGMIEGYRSLVPELRTIQGLEFDVMPMPSLDGAATVGEITGLCLSAATASSAQAADFLVHALSTPSVTRVTRTGYLVPANLEVALSDDFLQRGRSPQHSEVFTTSVRSMRLMPLMESYAALEKAVAPRLRELLSVPILDLDALTEATDEASRRVLAPETESESPSPE
jgi:multiple sugar transport system substrate-binding protein